VVSPLPPAPSETHARAAPSSGWLAPRARSLTTRLQDLQAENSGAHTSLEARSKSDVAALGARIDQLLTALEAAEDAAAASQAEAAKALQALVARVQYLERGSEQVGRRRQTASTHSVCVLACVCVKRGRVHMRRA
jgi:hypothetical protein